MGGATGMGGLSGSGEKVDSICLNMQFHRALRYRETDYKNHNGNAVGLVPALAVNVQSALHRFES